MAILVAHDGSQVCEGLVAAAQAIGRTADWPVRLLQVEEAGVAPAACEHFEDATVEHTTGASL